MNRSIESTQNNPPTAGSGSAAGSTPSATAGRLGSLLCVTIIALAPLPGGSQPLGSAGIQVVGLAVDIDTRADVDGFQYELTAVKDLPSVVRTFVGQPGVWTEGGLPVGSRVVAELTGPGIAGTRDLSAIPNGTMQLGRLAVAGLYTLSAVRVVDDSGLTIIDRDPKLGPVAIEVIDELLVTQVTSRPLTTEEIEERGIVIDSDDFTAMSFTVGMTIGSEAVEIELPVLIPEPGSATTEVPPVPGVGLGGSSASGFQSLGIPNFSLSGFTMEVPPEEEVPDVELPPITGLIVIPGDIGFLNEFFSVLILTTNTAPDGSGLAVHNARAEIFLPPGLDDVEQTGDEPLELEPPSTKTQALVDDTGDTTIFPQTTNQTEFLVEGKQEGTYAFHLDIGGDVDVPALGTTVPVSGQATGVVRVRNPTFSIILAHPQTVREAEQYSFFATVTNTSVSPANYFQLAVEERSLIGSHLAPGETSTRSLPILPSGASETFEFRMVAATTGEVTGTVFLADPGVNGSFRLTAGVGDTGIPLSPDTLVLPQTVQYLPQTPDVTFAAVRLLGQGYSVATAPLGKLPPDIPRISKQYVFDRAIALAQAGLHAQLGQTPLQTAIDLLSDYTGSDIARLDEIFGSGGSSARSMAADDLEAFDVLRRRSAAGRAFSEAIGELVGQELATQSMADLQLAAAERLASRPPHLAFGVESGNATVYTRLTDDSGQAVGRLSSDEALQRSLPHAAHLPLRPAAEGFAELSFVAAAQAQQYDLELFAPEAATVTISLIMPLDAGMARVTYPSTSLPAGAFAQMRWQATTGGPYIFYIDADGDGSAETTLSPSAVTPIADPPPSIIAAQCWGKGDRPEVPITLAHGDPLGRLVAVLFDEEVTADTAEALSSYVIPAHAPQSGRLQPDERLVFLSLDKPVGPFIPRTLTVSGVLDRRGNPIMGGNVTIAGDSERGEAGVVQGVVREPDGTPIPFASVDYIQPVYCWPCDFGAGRADNYVVSTFLADGKGRYQIDFVLRDAVAAGPDRWLTFGGAGATNHFKLEATDPQTGNRATASTMVHLDGQRQNVDLILRGRGSIIGDVFATDGSLCAGGTPACGSSLSVAARHTATGEGGASWVDSTGAYAFPRAAGSGGISSAPTLPVGNVVLTVVDPQAADPAFAVATTNVPYDGAVVEQDLHLVSVNAWGTITGRVVEADGQSGAAHVPVEISAGGIGTAPIDAVITDETGGFVFDPVPAGDVTVHAYRLSTFEEALASTTLGDGETRSVTVLLPGTGATVRGHVYDSSGNGVADATVAAGPTITFTDELGYYEVNGLPVTRFTVYAQGPGSLSVSTEQVTITSGSDDLTVDLWLEPTGSISGQVRRADGDPVSDQAVQLWTAQEPAVIGRTVTDANGFYDFAGYPLGDYSVRAVEADYGDGGMTRATLTYPDEQKVADVVFRGLGTISGTVQQTNGTPVMTDVIVRRQVWRILGGQSAQQQETVAAVQAMMGQNAMLDAAAGAFLANYDVPANDFYIVRSEPVLVRSDILGPEGEVTGQFLFGGPATAGHFIVQAIGPFFNPATVYGDMPLGGGSVDVGIILLEPSAGEVSGTVLMPDGLTPAGEGVRVTLRASGSSSSPYNLPPMDLFTDANGQFHFALVPSGPFAVVADTLSPASAAPTAADIDTETFAGLNVRLYGSISGAVPGGDTAIADVRLRDVAGVDLLVVDNAGAPVPYAQVSLRTAATLDADEESTVLASKTASVTGQIELYPVIEGAFSVSAKDPATLAVGQAGGQIPVNPEPGTILPITVKLGAVTTAEGDQIETPTFGTVQGTVYQADGTALVNPAQIEIRATGLHLLTTSDAQGFYSADHVPGGSFAVAALEPFTGRTGRASGRITSEGEVVTVPVTLVGLGTVTGTVLEHDGGPPPHSAQVLLLPSGTGSSLLATTTPDGAFSLPGVPIGDYTITAETLVSHLTGGATGTVEADGDLVTTDLFLEPHGRITGTVYDADGNPADSPSIYLAGEKESRALQADAVGAFDSGLYLPVGTYSLRAALLGGSDGGWATAVLAEHGQVVDVAITAYGHGTVQGLVLEAGGEPVAGALVELVSDSGFASPIAPETTATDGSFAFSSVPVGSFSIVATQPGTLLKALGNGTLAAHNDTYCFGGASACTVDDSPLSLQPAAAIAGVALESDGQTPAGDTVVTASGGVTVTRRADSQGAFSLPGLPLGTYNVTFYHPTTGGVASRPGVQLATNDVDADLGDVVLDSEPPAVTATSPVASASEVPPSSPIAVTFSEPIAAGTLRAGTGTLDNILLTIAGQAVPFTFALSDAGGLANNVLTLTPGQSLPDRTRVEVTLRADIRNLDGNVLGPGIRDASGLSLLADYWFEFVTADGTGPAVTSIDPADGEIEVALDSVVRVAFNEPIDPSSITDFSLAGVSSTWAAAQNDTVLILMPDALLAPDTTYTATLDGIADPSGNPVAGSTVTTTFDTVDTLPPVITSLVEQAGSLVVHGNTVTIEATVADVTDTAAVHLRVGGNQVATQSAPASGSRFDFALFLDPSLGSPIAVTAVAEDAAGNQSTPASLELSPAANAPPDVTLAVSPPSSVNAGDTVTVDVTATHAVGVVEVGYSAGGGAFGAASEVLDPHATPVTRQYTFQVPSDTPTGTSISVRANATDVLGETTTTSLTTPLSVVDTKPPVVAILAPSAGARLPQGDFSVLVDASDSSGIKTILLDEPAPAQTSQEYTGRPTAVSETFTVTRPADPGTGIVIQATAEDWAGNTATTQITVWEADETPPSGAIASPADGATDVPNDTTVVATFNEAIDPTTITAAAFVVSTGGTPAAGQFSVLPGRTEVRWRPAKALLPGAVYDVELGIGITDLAGNGLAAVVTSQFTVDASSIIDSDLDGLTDVTEMAIGTDPNVWDDFPNMDLVLATGGEVVVDEPLVLNSLTLTGNTTLTHSAATSVQAYRIDLVVGTLTIDAGSRIDVDEKGYLGGLQPGNAVRDGRTLGNELGADTQGGRGNGGSYGGSGATSYYFPSDGSCPNPPYGDFRDPNEHGSGGSAPTSSSTPGGSGGGFVAITASVAVVDGTLTANGGDGIYNQYGSSGGGSGGGIRIDVATLRGGGTISASGGRGQNVSGAGSGGRIAIRYGDATEFPDLADHIGAFGGNGATAGDWTGVGGAGTIFLQSASDVQGVLIVENGGRVAASGSTPLPSIGPAAIDEITYDQAQDRSVLTDADGSFPTLGAAGLLAGMHLDPNTDLPGSSFAIVDNTETQIHLEGNATAVAGNGDTYLCEYSLEAVTIANGAKVDLGSCKVDVAGTMIVDGGELLVSGAIAAEDLGLGEGGVLTHHPTSRTRAHRLELALGSLDLAATAAIDVSGKGYVGGYYDPSNPSDPDFYRGRTLGNTLGAGKAGNYASGGSYGGRGGPSYFDGSGASVTATYGSFADPNELGSGGAKSGPYQASGANGGGLVRIVATDANVLGSILANGGDGGGGGGGGSGGGILLDVVNLSGNGQLSANGGRGYAVGETGDYTYVGAGGGGRIAVYYADATGFPDLAGHLTATGGHGYVQGGHDSTTGELSREGGAGTIFVKGASQTYGELIVDNAPHVPRPDSTPLRSIGPGTSTSIEYDAGRALWKLVVGSPSFPLPGAPAGALGLIGLQLKPDTGDSASFLVVDNNATEIFVSGDMSAVTQAQPFIGVYSFDSLQIDGRARVTTTDEVYGAITLGDYSTLDAANYP